MSMNLYRNYSQQFARNYSLPQNESLLSESLPASWKIWLASDKTINILDFGSGWGHFLLSLHKLGYTNLTGIDSDFEMCEVAKKFLPTNINIVHTNDSEEWLSSQKEKFDLVIMNNVIEHIHIDIAVQLLTAIRHSLKPGGQIFISTPNMACMFGTYTRYVDLTHVIGFTEFSLFQLLDLAGFKEHRITSNIPYINFSNWRPWKPWRGLGFSYYLRRLIFSFMFKLSGATPVPTCYESHLDVLSKSA